MFLVVSTVVIKSQVGSKLFPEGRLLLWRTDGRGGNLAFYLVVPFFI